MRQSACGSHALPRADQEAGCCDVGVDRTAVTSMTCPCHTTTFPSSHLASRHAPGSLTSNAGIHIGDGWTQSWTSVSSELTRTIPKGSITERTRCRWSLRSMTSTSCTPREASGTGFSTAVHWSPDLTTNDRCNVISTSYICRTEPGETAGRATEDASR